MIESYNKKEFKDEEGVCSEFECGTKFTITVGEQEFMQRLVEDGKLKDKEGNILKEFHLPKRCPECRQAKKIREIKYKKY